jgi:hypothetical protein
MSGTMKHGHARRMVFVVSRLLVGLQCGVEAHFALLRNAQQKFNFVEVGIIS